MLHLATEGETDTVPNFTHSRRFGDFPQCCLLIDKYMSLGSADGAVVGSLLVI